MIHFGEKSSSTKSDEIDTLNGFISKSNQSLSSFVNAFDYLNDGKIDFDLNKQIFLAIDLDSVITRNVRLKTLESEILEDSDSQMEQTEIDNEKDDDDEMENIDLEKAECKLNGFWHNKGVNSLVKFDNFVTSLSEDNEFESNDKDLGTFVGTRTYSPSRYRKKDNKVEIEKMSQEEADLKLTGKNFQNPGLLIDEIEYFNEKNKMLITLNLVKCESQVEMDSTKMTSNYVEEFRLDPTHDYSKYLPSSRYELNKKFYLKNKTKNFI